MSTEVRSLIYGLFVRRFILLARMMAFEGKVPI
jgi:hypothetical protein